MRVLEEAARFVLDSQPLSSHAKKIRHDLASALNSISSKLPDARRIESDVGRLVSTESEKARADVMSVVSANASRLKESLRAIEEYSKILDSSAGEALQDIRYEFYSFERRLLHALSPKVGLKDCVLCVIVSSSAPGGMLETAQQVIRAGSGMIQFREKEAPDREVLKNALALRKLTMDKGVIFIVNDRADIASACGADGVHVGLDDLPVNEARRLLGPDAIIGASAHSVEEAVSAQENGADYIGAGSLFPTLTKTDAVVRGVNVFREISEAVNIPCFAIGGVTPENISEAIDAGVKRIAVSAGIVGSKDPENATRQIRKALLPAAGNRQ